MTQCFEYRRNLGDLFGFGGPRASRCKNEASHAVRIGEGSASSVNGWRPVCWICADTYAGYTVVPIADAGIS